MPSSFPRLMRTVIAVLVVVWAAALIGSFALKLGIADVPRGVSSWLLRSTSPMVVLIGWLLWAAGRGVDGLGSVRLLAAIAMSVSCVGDIVMGQVIPTPEPILSGVVVFGIAHVLYIAAFGMAASGLGLTSAGVRAASIGAALAIGVACWVIFVQTPSAGLALNAGTLIYALIIGSMGGMALSLALQNRRFILTAIGAGLFMLSDVMLGAWALRETRWEYIGDAVWWSYIVGQLLIVWTTGVLRSCAAAERAGE